MSQPITAKWHPMSNVGDRLTPWLVEKITGDHPTFAERERDGHILVGAGSILNWARSGNIVWGAGLASFSDEVVADCDIRAVRGPLSRAKALAAGCTCPETYGDPGLLLPTWLPAADQGDHVGIVPHYVDQERASIYRSRGAGVINVLQPVETFVAEITACSFVFSSSLHGLVIADAYGIPNAWIKLSDSVLGDGMKFFDHLMAVGRYPDLPIDCRETEVPLEKAPELAGLYRLGVDPGRMRDQLMGACPLNGAA